MNTIILSEEECRMVRTAMLCRSNDIRKERDCEPEEFEDTHNELTKLADHYSNLAEKFK